MAATFYDNPNQEVVRADGSGPEKPVETPVITSIMPTSRVVAPTDDITLHVYGTGFVFESFIHFAGHEERTRMVSTGELTTGITGSLFAGPDTVDVSVRTDGLESNVVPFEFTAFGIGSVTPTWLPYNTDNAEAYATPIVLRGAGFVDGCTVAGLVAGLPNTQGTYDVEFVSTTEVHCSLNSWTWAINVGSIQVVVVNPGGVESNSIEMPIQADNKVPPLPGTLAITSPTAGSTVEPVHDVLGIAPIGATVELHSIPGGPGPVATTTADPFGTFQFTGDTPVTPGIDMAWFVRVGDVESAPVPIHVAGEAVYDPGAHSVEDVKTHVTAHPDQRDAVYDAEVAGKARSTLLDWLEGQP